MFDKVNPHDRFFKQTFGDSKIASEFLQNYLPASLAVLFDTDSLELINTTFVDEDLQEHLSDLLYKVNLKRGGEAFVYVLPEHKSKPDKWVALQLLRYLVRIWENAQREKAQTLPMVFPIVFYHGKQNWKLSKEFTSLFEWNEDFEFLRKFVPSFEYHLFDLSKYEDESLQGYAPLASALRLLRDIFRKDLKQKLPETFQLLANESEEKILERVVVMINYLLITKKMDEDEMSQSLTKGFKTRGGELMRTVIDDWVTIGLKEGLQKGRETGLQQGLQEGLQQGIMLGKSGMTLDLLEHKFGKLDERLVNRIKKLDETKTGELGFAMFNFNSLNDVNEWLKTAK